jgi:type IV pilus assembly protein PilV
MTRGFVPTGNHSRGFTLLEVLVAIAVLAVGLLGMATLVGSVINYNQLAQHVTTATTLAQDRIEELKNTGYDNIAEGSSTEANIDALGDAGGVYNRSTEVDEDAVFQNTKTVEVTVSWDWKGNTHNVVLNTIIAR